ncbi:MAG: VanZ family protein [Acidobacteriota bacterium]|nr:VanZ family protein [Acidobacteriota bacterium]
MMMATRSADNRAEIANQNRGGLLWRRRLWRYVPVLLWLSLISYASSGNLSASNTSRIIRPLVLFIYPGIGEADLLFVHFVVRKTAHFAEYAVLALLAARAFASSSQFVLRRWWWAASLLLVVCCALLDEYHQSLTTTRTGTIYDSLIDIAGGVFALAILSVWSKFSHR